MISIILWAVGFLAVGLLAVNAHGPIMFFPVMGIAPALLAAIPSILGVLGTLFKGKKTEMAPQQTPQQLQAYTQLLQLLMKKNQMGSDPMNQVRSMFYGQQAPQQPIVGGDARSPFNVRPENTTPRIQ